MADAKFYQTSEKLSLGQIAKLCGLRLPNNYNKKRVFNDVAPLDTADNNHVSFLNNNNYINKFKNSKAGACFFRKDFLKFAPKNMIPLITDDPYNLFALIANAFYPQKKITSGIHPKAHIETTAKFDNTVQIGPGAIISGNVQIGSNSQIGANTVILSGVTIGKNNFIGPNCTIGYSILGSNIKIHNGVRIGQDGFGFAANKSGFMKIPQLGRVLISDNVEIGANTTIDRGTGPDTIINEGVKIDNLVQIAHNVKIGKNSIIVSQSGVAGSTVIGDNVIIAGQVGIAGHLTIGDNVKIAAKSGIMKNIDNGKIVGGYPAVEIKDWHRQTIILKKIIKKKFNEE